MQINDSIFLGSALPEMLDDTLVIQQNKRLLFLSLLGNLIEIIVHGTSPLSLPDAVANSLSYVKAFGGIEQNGTPTPSTPATITCNNGILKVKDSELPVGYKRLVGITYDSNTYYETNEKLYGSDTLTITLSNTASAGRNVIGAYSGSGDDVFNFSLYVYGNGSSSNSYLRHGTKSTRPRYGDGTRTLVMGPTGTDGFLNNVTYAEEDFETTDTFRIGTLPNSSSSKFDGDMIGNITVSNRLKYIPCERTYDGAIGYYEIFTGAFLEPQGSGTPVSMGYDTSYMNEVYADGTVETIKDSLNNTATAEMLLKIGDYADVQEILSGNITRNVGVKVFDGTEDWTTSGTNGSNNYRFTINIDSNNNAGSSLCTHIDKIVRSSSTTQSDRPCIRFTPSGLTLGWYDTDNTTTLAQFKQFLADQYAAGTPVILVYPLAEPTTEVVAGQSLQVQEGDNTLEITQASLTGLELEAKYKKGV